MPAGAAMTVEMQIPVRTSALSDSRKLTNTFSYDGAAKLYVRFTERGSAPVHQPQGQYLNVDAVALIEATAEGLEPLELSNDGSGRREQVKINGAVWEVVRVRDLGGVDRMKEIQLRRWK